MDCASPSIKSNKPVKQIGAVLRTRCASLRVVLHGRSSRFSGEAHLQRCGPLNSTARFSSSSCRPGETPSFCEVISIFVTQMLRNWLPPVAKLILRSSSSQRQADHVLVQGKYAEDRQHKAAYLDTITGVYPPGCGPFGQNSPSGYIHDLLPQWYHAKASLLTHCSLFVQL